MRVGHHYIPRRGARSAGSCPHRITSSCHRWVNSLRGPTQWPLDCAASTAFSTAEESGYAEKDVPFDLEGALREEGAIYEATDPWQPKLAVDGRLITGQNPQSGTVVGEALVESLKQI